MSALIDKPTTAAALLFDGDPTQAIAARIAETDALADARKALDVAADDVWSGTCQQVSAIAADFCALDLASVLVCVWQKHKALYDAADRTSTTTESEIVDLGSRTVTAEQKPSIDVKLENVTVHIIRFLLTAEVAVHGITATVAHGAVVAVGGGKCDVTVRFGAAGTTLAEKSAAFDPKLTLPLGTPITLPRQRSVGRLRHRAPAGA